MTGSSGKIQWVNKMLRLTPEVGSEPAFLVFVTSAGKSGLQRSSLQNPTRLRGEGNRIRSWHWKGTWAQKYYFWESPAQRWTCWITGMCSLDRCLLIALGGICPSFLPTVVSEKHTSLMEEWEMVPNPPIRIWAWRPPHHIRIPWHSTCVHGLWNVVGSYKKKKKKTVIWIEVCCCFWFQKDCKDTWEEVPYVITYF